MYPRLCVYNYLLITNTELNLHPHGYFIIPYVFVFQYLLAVFNVIYLSSLTPTCKILEDLYYN